MIPVATVDQMRACDRDTIEKIGLPGMVLMENASRAVAAKVVDMLGGNAAGRLVWAFCGRGNNGGDGLAAARQLRNLGARVEVFLVGKPGSLSGDAKANLDLFDRIGGKVRDFEWSLRSIRRLPQPDIVIDALLGTGTKGTVKGVFAEAIDVIDGARCPVLAVDIPSGVYGDTGAVAGSAVSAHATVTFGLLKAGLVLPPGRDLAGDVSVADIGIPPQVVQRRRIRQFVVEPADVAAALPQRARTAHKGDAGHVYIIAGSPGMSGAAALAAEAAMKTGAGLVVVGVPTSLNPIMEAKLTESMTQPLPENARGALSNDAFTAILPRIEWADAVILGPGLSGDPDTAALVERLIDITHKPLILDADALSYIAESPRMRSKLPPHSALTPHPGEFARITGTSVAEILSDKISISRRWSVKLGVTMVVKGSPTVTALADGRVFINPTGNPGMATGGSGDTLAGMIASLAAQGAALETAAWMGVYVHGAAGDLARDEHGEAGMVAGDIVNMIPRALKSFA